MVEALIFLALLAGGAVYGVTELKTGFSKTRKLAAAAKNSWERLTLGPPNPEKQADKILNVYAARLHALREGTAMIKAQGQQAERNAVEEKKSSGEAQKFAESALARGEELLAGQAMTLAVEAEKRAGLFGAAAENLHIAHEGMMGKLDFVEAEFEDVKTRMETLKTHHRIAEANKQVYALISEVSGDGLSTGGQFKQLAEETERKAIASAEMINMAVKNSQSGIRALERLLDKEEVQRRLEEARKRIALPSGQPSALNSPEK